MPQTLSILRHRRGILAAELEPAWGTTLHPAEDPTAPEVPPALLGAVQLPPDFPRIPAPLWAAFRDLCFHFLNWETKEPDSAQEVQVVWTRRGPNFQEWEGWVPTQVIGGATVDTDLRVPLLNLLTGERFDSLAALTLSGRAHAGSSHSHNVMGCFFSSRDDAGELSVPGLHAVLGECARKVDPNAPKPHRRRKARAKRRALVSYGIAPSLVLRGKRYEQIIVNGQVRDMEPWDIIDVPADGLVGRLDSRTFHPDVLTVVSRHTPAQTTSTTYAPGWGQYGTPTGYEGVRSLTADQLELEYPWIAAESPAACNSIPDGEVCAVYPATVDPAKCWVQRKSRLGTELELVAKLPERWQKIVAAKRARWGTPGNPTTSPPTTATPKVRLYRNEQAGTIAEALLLADMVTDTIRDPDTPDDVWKTLVGALARKGFTFTATPSHTAVPVVD